MKKHNNYILSTNICKNPNSNIIALAKEKSGHLYKKSQLWQNKSISRQKLLTYKT